MIYGNIIAEGGNSNAMFRNVDKTPHGGTLNHAFKLLRQTFLAQEIEINSPDINQGRPIAFDLLIDGRHYAEDGIPKYLIALENPNINHLNENLEYCSRFAKVFAWDVRLHGLPNAVKILIPNQLSFSPFLAFEQRDIFSCLINANKAFRDTLPSDLYLERINTINWYEKYAPDKFELYGMGWAKPPPAFKFWGKVRRSFPSLWSKLFGYKPFSSYRGEVSDKAEVLRRSKFCYCYENTRDLSNYITEKIFDCLLSGCVPIYWGADNVLDYFPEACFIDRRDFKDTAAVHEFLLSITSGDYSRYQYNIARFLNSDRARLFSSESFVSTVAGEILQDVRRFARI